MPQRHLPGSSLSKTRIAMPELGFYQRSEHAPASGKLTGTAKRAVHMHTAAYEPQLSSSEVEGTVKTSDGLLLTPGEIEASAHFEPSVPVSIE